MILGLISPAGGGKDTTAMFLKPYGFKRVSLADEVRKDMLELVDIPERRLEAYKDKKLRIVYGDFDSHIGYFSIRNFLQKYATDIIRDRFDQDYWVKRALNNTANNQHSAVTDVRFQNEIDYIRNNDGLIVYVDRKGYEGSLRKHKSEGLANDSDIKNKVDIVIDNGGTLEDLKNTLDTLMKELNIENSIYTTA
tara:strand:+ start:165 stop:746 length:582 start_codon:yes stop_codon:yes gene_type:complete